MSGISLSLSGPVVFRCDRFRWAGPRCRVAQIELAGRPVLLAKPLWNINKAGGPVAALMRARQVPALRLVVVQDDLDFPFGSVWLKRGGGLDRAQTVLHTAQR